MWSRRNVLVGLSTLAVTADAGQKSWATGNANGAAATFDTLLSSIRNEPKLIDQTRQTREGAIDAFDFYVSKAVAPRPTPSTRRVSDRARDLIETFEITSAQLYKKAYRHPVWPGGESGVTIGVGYDLGYVTPSFLKSDWEGILPPATIETLKAACRLRAEAAHSNVKKFRSVDIAWALAQRQFTERLLPLYIAETIERLPNANKLSDDSLGAIVSLVYNRGGNFTSHHPRRAEMRAIRQLVEDGDRDSLAMIPTQLRKMQRLWLGKPKMKGLVIRRELEAQLFEAGLTLS